MQRAAVCAPPGGSVPTTLSLFITICRPSSQFGDATLASHPERVKAGRAAVVGLPGAAGPGPAHPV